METRAMRESEIEECIDLAYLVFPDTTSPRFRHHLTDDSSFELEQARVCIADGRIVSFVRVSDRPIHVGFAVVRMGGIGAVATHPDCRGRGCSTALLWDAVHYMERAGYDLSMLFTHQQRHYAKVGWAACFPEHSYSLPPGEPPEVETPYSLRPFDEARDLDAVMAIYNRYTEERSGTLARPRQYWLDRHSRTMGVLPNTVVERDGEMVAYLRGTETNFGELAYLPGHAEAVVPLCVRAMRAAVAAADPTTAPRVTGQLPRSHPALELLLRWNAPRGPVNQENEGMMLRVIRLAPLMQQVAPVLERRLAQAGLLPRRVTVILRELGQAVRVVINGRHLHVEACDVGDSGDITLEPGTRSFFELLFGDSTFGQLRELIPGADAVAPQDAVLLEVLFPKQEPVYFGCDHF